VGQQGIRNSLGDSALFGPNPSQGASEYINVLRGMRAGQPGSVFEKNDTMTKIDNQIKMRPQTAH
jgi:hypothetical protein